MKNHVRQAFTLIEMLVVVVVIAILAGIVFRMISIIGRHGDRARTVARIQRLANALEGFHAEYGQYPPWRDTACRTANSCNWSYSSFPFPRA